jgi:ABC-type antimicrobial peptide transport system permease subunit
MRAYYVPFGQQDSATRQTPILYVRSVGDAALLVPAVRRMMQTIAPDLPYPDVAAFSTVFDPESRPWRLGVTMFSIFGAVALGLAIVGLYGVLAFRVGQRTHEIGVRIALGAQRADVRRLVLGQGLRLVALGVAIGLAVAVAVGPAFASLLFGVSARDPLVFATTGGALLVVAALASYLPALRATRIDPMEAVREL